MIRKHIVFTGAVQGVGFRYRARHAAELYGCTGWVRNEYDGSVVMEIQGEEEQIDRVILAVERGTFVRIENMEAKTLTSRRARRDSGAEKIEKPAGRQEYLSRHAKMTYNRRHTI